MTHIHILYQTYHRISKYDTVSPLNSPLLSHETSQAVLRDVKSTIKIEFPRTVRVYFCYMLNEYRDTHASGHRILLWSSVEVAPPLLSQKF